MEKRMETEITTVDPAGHQVPTERLSAAQEAMVLAGQYEARIQNNNLKIAAMEEQKQGVIQRIATLLSALGVQEDVARVKHWWSKWMLRISTPLMWAVSFAVVYIALEPSFYTRKLWAGVIASAGAVSSLLAVETILYCLYKVLTPRHTALFNAIVTLVMVASLFGGMMHLAQARAALMKLQNCSESVSVIDDSESKGCSDDEIRKIREEIDKKNKRGMLLLAVGYEWMVGFFIFRAGRSFLRYRPVVNCFKEQNRLDQNILQCRQENVSLGA